MIPYLHNLILIICTSYKVGETTIDLARQNGHADIVNLLETAKVLAVYFHKLIILSFNNPMAVQSVKNSEGAATTSTKEGTPATGSFGFSNPFSKSGSAQSTTSVTSKSIFDLCKEGDEQGVRRLIAADRAVVHERDWVSCSLSEIHSCIYIYCIVHVDAHLISHLYYIQLDRTPLHIAAEKGHTATAQLLLQAGADKDAKDKVSTY